MAGNAKSVYVTPNKYDDIEASESALRIGIQNPNGATDSPTYRVQFKMSSVTYNYAGNVEGGSGIEMTTNEKIYVDTSKIAVLPHKDDSDDNNDNNSGSGSNSYKGDNWGNDPYGTDGLYFWPINLPISGPEIVPIPELVPVF